MSSADTRTPAEGSPDDGGAALTVYHDGGCPVCRAEVSLMRRLDERRDVRWVDITTEPDALAAAGIGYRDAMERLHCARRPTVPPPPASTASWPCGRA